MRLRTALADLYGFYASTEPMRANVLRDAQTMPELAALLEGSVVPYLEEVRDVLAGGWEVRGKEKSAYVRRSRWHSTSTPGARWNEEAA